MSALLPGQSISTLRDVSGATVLTYTITWNPSTDAMVSVVAVNSTGKPVGVVLAAGSGTPQSVTLPAGTTTINATQLTAVGLATHASLGGVTVTLG